MDASVSCKKKEKIINHIVFLGGNAAVVILNHSWINVLESKLDTRVIVAAEMSTDASLLFPLTFLTSLRLNLVYYDLCIP